jgi:hypothetical protein
MSSGSLAALVATLALGFVEGVGRFYPAQRTWRRLRRRRGRAAMRAMRERFEAAGGRGAPRVLTQLLLGLVIVWVAVASLLDKRWYEVVLDVLPYTIVYAALWRTPPAMRAVAERMRGHERDAGEDPEREPDEEGEGEGPSELAL